MEEPNPRIIRHNSKRHTRPRRHMHSIPPHRVRLAFDDGRVEGWVFRGVVGRAVDELHGVAVEMAVTRITFSTMVSTFPSWSRAGRGRTMKDKVRGKESSRKR